MKVKTYLIDVNYTDKNTDNIAMIVSHELKRLFPDNVDIKLQGQCTDSGGGGGLHCFAGDFLRLDLVGERFITVFVHYIIYNFFKKYSGVYPW